MRKRFENRICKALRIASALEPRFVRQCHKLASSSGGVATVLAAIVASRTRPAHERVKAAELLSLARVRAPFEPILEYFLECDASTAWDIVTALPTGLPTFAPNPEALMRVLKHDPDPERRAATIRLFWHVRVSGGTKLLQSVFEDPAETGYVRGRAAEALTYLGRASVIDAMIRSLKAEDAAVRFWSVFAIGQIARPRRHLHVKALEALRPMVEDNSELPYYWSVGREAQAMIEYFDPAAHEYGRQERTAILADPASPEGLRFWATGYSDNTDPATHEATPSIEGRYKNLRWRRFNVRRSD